MLLLTLKITFSKNKPREIFVFFSKGNIGYCSKFNQTFLDVLNKHAPSEKKSLRADHTSYVSKSMRKAIIRRSYLEMFISKKERTSLGERTKTEKLLW